MLHHMMTSKPGIVQGKLEKLATDHKFKRNKWHVENENVHTTCM